MGGYYQQPLMYHPQLQLPPQPPPRREPQRYYSERNSESELPSHRRGDMTRTNWGNSKPAKPLCSRSRPPSTFNIRVIQDSSPLQSPSPPTRPSSPLDMDLVI